MATHVAHVDATDKFHLLWLEAAYLYYLHPEINQILTDYSWDGLGKSLMLRDVIAEGSSLFHLKEEDYPLSIREKYKK